MPKPNVEKIIMRHPHTGDTVEVEATSEALTPWMVKGYEQQRGQQVPKPQVENEKGE